MWGLLVWDGDSEEEIRGAGTLASWRGEVGAPGTLASRRRECLKRGLAEEEVGERGLHRALAWHGWTRAGRESHRGRGFWNGGTLEPSRGELMGSTGHSHHRMSGLKFGMAGCQATEMAGIRSHQH